MTEHDKKLIQEALKTDYINWENVVKMVGEAESKEAKKKLTDILRGMYHREEFFANNL